MRQFWRSAATTHAAENHEIQLGRDHGQLTRGFRQSCAAAAEAARRDATCARVHGRLSDYWFGTGQTLAPDAVIERPARLRELERRPVVRISRCERRDRCTRHAGLMPRRHWPAWAMCRRLATLPALRTDHDRSPATAELWARLQYLV